MTHFAVLVLVDGTQPAEVALGNLAVRTVARTTMTETEMEQLVAPLLARYDENTEVPPYERECYCVGLEPRRRAGDKARAAIGDPPPIDDAFVTWERQFDAAKAAILAADPDASKANPECEECHGTGKDTTTYNPLSKWDWYQVGGRWDGFLENNWQPAAALLARPDNDWIVGALVTPDGDWHQKGRMGWFGIMTDVQYGADWNDEVRGCMKQHPKAIAVVVDCHI